MKKSSILVLLVASVLAVGCDSKATKEGISSTAPNEIVNSSEASSQSGNSVSSVEVIPETPGEGESQNQSHSSQETNNSISSNEENNTSSESISSQSSSSSSIDNPVPPTPKPTGDISPDYGNYYDSIGKVTGTELQSELTKLITKNHHALGYDGLLTAYKTTDCYPGTNIIWDMYSNEEFVCGGDKQNKSYKKEGDGYNREHSVPQSWFNKASTPRCDIFHVYPTDGYVNNRRSSYLYGEVSSPTYTSLNGSKLGPSKISSYKGTVFEPIDEYKGDFARTYFYMATRYANECGSWSGGAFTSSFPHLTKYNIELFTKWSEQDPVSAKEVLRNNAAYTLQKNRNPFIDHPEYVDMIFGGHTTFDPNINADTPTPGPIEGKTDEEIANDVIKLINNIGEVTKSSGNAINKARTAYNALTDAQKELVTNYKLLEQKEAEYLELNKVDVSGQVICEVGKDGVKGENSITSNSIKWDLSANIFNVEEDTLQFTNNSLSSPLTFESSSYSNEITKITLKVKTNGEVSKVSFTVKVGDKELTTSDSIKKDMSDLTFTSNEPLKGKISITYNKGGQAKKSFYIKTITIN